MPLPSSLPLIRSLKGSELLMGTGPNPNAAAVLVWLPKGTTPDIRSFSVSAAAAHMTIKPVAYWLLSDALHVAETDTSHPNHELWIKVGESLLNHQQIHDLYGAAQAFTADLCGEKGATRP